MKGIGRQCGPWTVNSVLAALQSELDEVGEGVTAEDKGANY